MSLLTDLQAAGLPVVAATEGISAMFSRDLTAAEMEVYLNLLFPSRQAQIDRKAAAAGHALAIPGWANWTEAQVLSWGETNIGTPLANARTSLPATLTLATARAAFIVLLGILDQMWTMQKSMARMLVALRDETWPGLSG